MWWILTLSPCIAAPQGPVQSYEVKLVPHDAEAGDYFGQSVAIDQGIALISAPHDDDLGTLSGSVYAFVRSGSLWSQEAKLLAPDGDANDRFGWSVALAGDMAIVGVPLDDVMSADSGSAWVFHRNSGAWSPYPKLWAADGSLLDRFGRSVGISGDLAVVGAPFDDDHGSASGSSYVFARAGTAWMLEAKLVASDAAAQDEFGASVAISGTTIVVGSSQHDDLGTQAGAAYVFVRRLGTWAEQAKLLASDGAAWDRFGSAVAIDDGTIVVSAPLDDNQAPDTGAAYVFHRVGTTWEEHSKLVASDGAELDLFGSAVSVSGAQAVVGAVWSDPLGPQSGSVYTFTSVGGAWVQGAVLLASDGAAGDLYGQSVDVSDGSVLVGAYLADAVGKDSGSAYLELPSPYPPPAVYCTAKTNSLGCLPEIGFTGSASAATSTGFAVHAVNVRNGRPGWLLHSIAGRIVTPFQGGLLCIARPIRRTPELGSGGNPPPILDCSGAWRVDMNAFASGKIGGLPAPELRVPGTSVHCQWWGRDPGSVAGSCLTDALVFTVRP